MEQQAEDIPIGQNEETTEQEWKEMFSHLDEDGSGQLDRTELQNLLYLAGQNPTDAMIDNILASIGKNSDDTVSFEDFCNIMKTQPNPENDMKEAFNYFDKNGDGTVSREELTEILRQDNSIDPNEEYLTELFNNCDKNGDGQLSIDEFVSFLQHPDRIG